VKGSIANKQVVVSKPPRDQLNMASILNDDVGSSDIELMMLDDTKLESALAMRFLSEGKSIVLERVETTGQLCNWLKDHQDPMRFLSFFDRSQQHILITNAELYPVNIDSVRKVLDEFRHAPIYRASRRMKALAAGNRLPKYNNQHNQHHQQPADPSLSTIAQMARRQGRGYTVKVNPRTMSQEKHGTRHMRLWTLMRDLLHSMLSLQVMVIAASVYWLSTMYIASSQGIVEWGLFAIAVLLTIACILLGAVKLRAWLKRRAKIMSLKGRLCMYSLVYNDGREEVCSEEAKAFVRTRLYDKKHMHDAFASTRLCFCERHAETCCIVPLGYIVSMPQETRFDHGAVCAMEDIDDDVNSRML
jgi:hypothetical protein